MKTHSGNRELIHGTVIIIVVEVTRANCASQKIRICPATLTTALMKEYVSARNRGIMTACNASDRGGVV